MTDMLKMGRKALTVGVAATTIAWSMMAATLVAPISASAAGCTAGSLIKGSLSAVYYCGSDGKRYVFPNEKTYMTWYSDFSSVVRISDADLAALQIGGNVTYRPGVKMVKITTSPTVYAISKGGVLRPVASEAAAVALYGSNWNTQIDDVSDAFFTNYTVGSAVASTSDFDKSAEMSAAQSINVDKNLGGSSSPSTGTMMVAPAIDNPSATTLPLGATGVNMVKFVISNNSSVDATVTNAVVKRVGPGATTDFSNVYLYEGATRLTSGRTINSSTNEANFTGVNLTVAAGQSRTLWVAADISTTGHASDVQELELESLQAGAATIGGLPVMGPNMTLSGATVGSLTIAKSGSISDPKVGQTNVEVAEFTLTAGSSEDVWFQRLTLFQGGNLAGANLTNLKLEQAGNVVATATSLDSKLHVVFNLASPMMLSKGAQRTFQVFADIAGSARSGDTIKLYVEEQADVYGVGATYGQGVTVANANYDGSAALCTTDSSCSTVAGGQLTMTFNGPSSKNIAANSKGVELFNFTMAAQGNIEVKKLVLNVACSPSTAAGGCVDTSVTPNVANYTNIKVINTATQQVWWGPADLDATLSDTLQPVTFTDIQDLAAGSSQTFSVVADVGNDVPTGNAVTVTLTAFGSSDLRNLDNNTFVDTSAVVPSGDMQGNQQSIVAPSLALSLASSPVSGAFVKGSTAVPFVGINLKAGDGADIKVTSLTLRGYIDDTGAVTPTMLAGKDTGHNNVAVSDDILGCKLFDGSTQVGDSKSPTTGTGGLLQYTSLNLTVPMSSTKTLALKCDISNSAYRNTNPEVIGFSLANADVTAQDPSGNSLIAGTNLTGSTNAIVGTALPVRVTVTSTGSVTAQLAPDDTESQNSLVVAGDPSAVIGKWRFTASNEELNLDKLTFVLVNNSAYRSISSVSLYDGSTLLAGPTSLTTGTATTAQFSGMTEVVPKDSSKTVTLKATLNNISSGAATGDNLKMQLWIPGTTLGDTAEFEARGTSSSTVIRLANQAGDITINSNDKLVRKTKPTVALASLPTSIVSNGGGIVLSRFTVTADAAENLSLKKLSFQVSLNGSVGETVTVPAVREVGSGSDISSASASVMTTGTNCGFPATTTNNCVRVVFSSEQVISAGTSKTYELRMTTSGFAASGDSVSTIMLGDSANAVGALSTAALGIDTTVNTPNIGTSGEYNFVWSDNSKIPHSDTAGGSADWTNGNYVKQLPADAQTMTRS